MGAAIAAVVGGRGGARDRAAPPGGRLRQRVVGPVCKSIYVLAALVAYLLALGWASHGWAAVAMAVAVMTKPQALPAARAVCRWYLARYGWRGERSGTGAIGAAVIALLWAPFLAFGGPAAYLRNLAEYQDEIFNGPVAPGVEPMVARPGSVRRAAR